MKKKKISGLVIASALLGMTMTVAPALTACQSEADKARQEAYESAKAEAESYIATIDTSKYDGDEKPMIESKIKSINDLISASATGDEINSAVDSLKSYIASAKTSEEKVYDSAKAEADEFLASFSLNDYRDPEKSQLEALVNALNAAIENKDADEITAKLNALKAAVSNAKTDADYRKEEEEAAAKALSEAKAAKIASVDVKDPTQYREEEITNIIVEKNKVIEAVNACSTIEEVNAVSTEAFEKVVKDSKTNAEYTVSEMKTYGQVSEWDLVTEHKDSWTYVGNKIITNSLDGYVIDSTSYGDEVTTVFSIDTLASGITNSALLLGHHDDEGGLEGYLINIDTSTGNQYVQVFYIDHAYHAGANKALQYIGGWIFNDNYPGEKVTGTDFRVVLKNGNVTLYKESAYQEKGEDAASVTVDLTAGGAYSLFNDIHVGFVHWYGTAYTAELKMIAGLESINGAAKAKKFAKFEEDAVNMGLYREKEQAAIVLLKDALDRAIADDDYAQIIAHIVEFKAAVALVKTDAQYKEEEEAEAAKTVSGKKVAMIEAAGIKEPTQYRKAELESLTKLYNSFVTKVNACSTMAELEAIDVDAYNKAVSDTKTNAQYTMENMKTHCLTSTWDLVTEHKDCWTYSSDGISTDANDGYVFDDYSYGQEVTTVFKVTSSAESNFNAGVLFGHIDTEGGIEGYGVTINYTSDHQYLQVWYIDSAFGGQKNVCNYLNGWFFDSVFGEPVNGATIRTSIKDGHLYVYQEADYKANGASAKVIDIDLTFGGTVAEYEDLHVGVLHWGATPFDIKFDMIAGKTSRD